MENVSPLRENGANTNQVGVPWPERTLLEEAFNVEHGEWFMVNVSRVRELSRDQPYEAEDVLSLSYPAPLRMNREKAENPLRFYMDLLRSKENSFRSQRETKVMARVLLLIIKYVNRRKFPGLDESRWPLSPFFISCASLHGQPRGAAFSRNPLRGKGLAGISTPSSNCSKKVKMMVMTCPQSVSMLLSPGQTAHDSR